MQDKVIVITGASAGIGEALAERVVAQGAAGVVLAARRAPELAALAERLGPATLAVPTDVSQRADNERLRDAALARFGRIDVWVANAGRGITRAPTELTDDDLEAMLAVNLRSVVYALQAALPGWKTAGRGHLIAVSSMLGRVPYFAGRSAYSMAKAAVNSFVTSARIEVRAEHPEIHLSTVMPGPVATGFGLSALHGGVDSRAFPGAQPAGEVADVIADVIARPRAEAYTRDALREMAARYYAADDVGALEVQPPFNPLPRSGGAE